MKAYFAGGCFWCMEKPYHEIPGVSAAVSGYCGGEEPDPTYEQVKAQATGHRETVEVTFDPARVRFSDLLEVYLASIDPFDDGGQFIDRGHSYTCAVYYTDEEQRRVVTDRLAGIERACGRRAAVSVEPFVRFYPAEEAHQNYAAKHPDAYREEERLSGRDAFFDKKER